MIKKNSKKTKEKELEVKKIRKKKKIKKRARKKIEIKERLPKIFKKNIDFKVCIRMKKKEKLEKKFGKILIHRSLIYRCSIHFQYLSKNLYVIFSLLF